ncbi:hypothetical protein Mgrana_02926 [Meiothermus granaticius NBRC 107808]|uniref:Uncharacterized protein n=1 Tax=Meiothermus granaticius NBRC 107808 TaxID=1227551 RepID=A0A399F4S3_9DEIN|nr:hypothetical protein Mgrana_02926 [Meiothermus granaticius NBRC 107808]
MSQGQGSRHLSDLELPHLIPGANVQGVEPPSPARGIHPGLIHSRCTPQLPLEVVAPLHLALKGIKRVQFAVPGGDEKPPPSSRNRGVDWARLDLVAQPAPLRVQGVEPAVFAGDEEQAAVQGRGSRQMPSGLEAPTQPTAGVQGVEKAIAPRQVDGLPYQRGRRELGAGGKTQNGPPGARDCGQATIPSRSVDPVGGDHRWGRDLIAQALAVDRPPSRVEQLEPRHQLSRPGHLPSKVVGALQLEPLRSGRARRVMPTAAGSRPRYAREGLPVLTQVLLEYSLGAGRPQRSLAGGFGHQGRYQPGNLSGEGGVKALGGFGHFVDVLVEHRLVILPLKQGLPGEGAVEHGTEAVEVGLGGQRQSPGLLRSHVLRGSQGIAGTGEVAALLHQVGQAEIHHLGLPVCGHQDVAGGQVAVNHPPGMEVLEGLQHLDGRLEQPHPLHPLLKGAQALEAPPLNQLHHEVGTAGLLAQVVDLHHPRMGKLGKSLDLLKETASLGGVDVGVQQLNGHLTVHPLIQGPPNLSHTPFPQRGVQPIPPSQLHRDHRVLLCLSPARF